MTMPVAAHKWEEQFKNKGERLGMPSAEKLTERIRELLAAIDGASDARLQRGYEREIAWRRTQLERLREAADD